jgi:hypothetical protein
MPKELKTYRVYGNDTDSYAFGGPLFPPIFLKEVKARTPQAAFEKVYRWNRRKHLNWRKSDLLVRSYNRRTKRAKTKRSR